LLIECCLELMSRGLVVGIQDMGAAGLTSSSFEMAARAGCGLDLDLDKVPMRETGMTPYELMLSESQERMLLVTIPENVASVINLCKRWGLDATDIGEVIVEPVVRGSFEGRPAFALPVAPLVDDAPRYERPFRRPEPAGPATLPALRDRDWGAELKTLLASPQMASARRIWEQYDQSVGAATVVGPGADAALVLIPGTHIGLAATTDCNAFACGLDPFTGASQALAEAVRNLACVGAEPVGVTDCLNFGSPENPAVMGQFVAAIDGLSEACRAFEVPVVSGNVSFYNETSGLSILPTPTIGMVGVVPEVRHVPRGSWELGEVLYLLGPTEGELGASRYLQVLLGLEAGPVPPVDYPAERRRARVVTDLVRLGLVAATDISDGGLAAALVRMGSPDCGADLALGWDSLVARALFGEWLGRFLLAVQPACEPALVQAADGLELHRLGTVGGDRLVVRVGKRIVLSESMAELCAVPERQLAWMEEA
ncbi:MAG TPA: AIR synthase-related protein, partial [Thermoanaerobaculaceae bacterium]|nr:AIR synthase-related protein [Thermoanaerobaculaceae bacterium]